MSERENESARADLRYIREIMDRAGRRIDPHLFHLVHWGAIVLVWYPVANLMELFGKRSALLPLGIGAMVLGAVLSAALEMRLKGRPRVGEGKSPVEKQVLLAIFGPLTLGVVLSALGPMSGFLEGSRVDSLWGLVYALMAWSIGTVYTKEWLFAAVFIFLGTLVAFFFPTLAGFITGGVMGLGILVPGILAERRVRRMRAEEKSEA